MNATFSTPEILGWLENQEPNQYDELSFGIVKMNIDGQVVFYNKQESQITGIDPAFAVGKLFFTQIAPCTNNFMVSEKYKQIELDEELDYLFTHITTPTRVRLRLLKSAASQHQYMLVHKY
ncbi:MAG: photoactive yellow protein [Sphingobacteriia bacterium]|jgi:photoactive yellow protein|nr:MAG: photoactive yellow protein [Sphingobacteriia bacterium]TAG29162.1 MAG: photoactive yellow protein [Sphingobacteriia bacterium]